MPGEFIRRSFARIHQESPALESPRHAPCDWPTMAVGPAAPLILEWSTGAYEESDGEKKNGWLSLTTAIDDREEKTVVARLARSRATIGEFEVSYAPSLTPYRLQLGAQVFEKCLDEGIVLSLERGRHPLWWIGPTLRDDTGARAPHLLLEQSTDRTAQFFQRLASLDSLQPFGWMEGCVMEALADLAAVTNETRYHSALRTHLAAFFKAGQHLVYEDARGERRSDALISIEATLPFAALARLDPAHSAIDLALTFWRTHTHAWGVIQDGDILSAEGNLTIAYPLAVIAVARSNRELMEIALQQLRFRRERLWSNGTIALRCSDAGHRTFINWARGVAWYFLGLVRTLVVLREYVDLSEFMEDVALTAQLAGRYQDEKGLWSCFIDDPTTAVDTSGSAGLAAALAIATQAGWLSGDHLAKAHVAWTALQSHLAPDGLLDGAAPANRAGEAFQRSRYRVLSPMGMGLMGQLAAALGGQINLAQALSMSANDGRS